MHHAHDAVVMMYRNDVVVDFDGRSGGILSGCACEYVTGAEWWSLRCNESVWIVPGTLDPDYRCTHRTDQWWEWWRRADRSSLLEDLS